MDNTLKRGQIDQGTNRERDCICLSCVMWLDCSGEAETNEPLMEAENLDFQKCDAQIRRTCTAAYSVTPCDPPRRVKFVSKHPLRTGRRPCCHCNISLRYTPLFISPIFFVFKLGWCCCRTSTKRVSRQGTKKHVGYSKGAPGFEFWTGGWGGGHPLRL